MRQTHSPRGRSDLNVMRKKRTHESTLEEPVTHLQECPTLGYVPILVLDNKWLQLSQPYAYGPKIGGVSG